MYFTVVLYFSTVVWVRATLIHVYTYLLLGNTQKCSEAHQQLCAHKKLPFLAKWFGSTIYTKMSESAMSNPAHLSAVECVKLQPILYVHILQLKLQYYEECHPKSWCKTFYTYIVWAYQKHRQCCTQCCYRVVVLHTWNKELSLHHRHTVKHTAGVLPHVYTHSTIFGKRAVGIISECLSTGQLIPLYGVKSQLRVCTYVYIHHLGMHIIYICIFPTHHQVRANQAWKKVKGSLL